jgi:hypothetical protein
MIRSFWPFAKKNNNFIGSKMAMSFFQMKDFSSCLNKSVWYLWARGEAVIKDTHSGFKLLLGDDFDELNSPSKQKL